MMKSLLIKAGMLAVTAAMVAWIGWPTQETAFIDASTDAPPQIHVPPSIIASTIPPAASRSLAVPERSRSKSLKSHETHAASKLDINRATVEEFRTLPGIGDVLARRMIERRTSHGPYRTVDDLRDVKGIGAKRLEQLRPLVVVSKANPPESRSKREL